MTWQPPAGLLLRASRTTDPHLLTGFVMQVVASSSASDFALDVSPFLGIVELAIGTTLVRTRLPNQTVLPSGLLGARVSPLRVTDAIASMDCGMLLSAVTDIAPLILFQGMDPWGESWSMPKTLATTWKQPRFVSNALRVLTLLLVPMFNHAAGCVTLPPFARARFEDIVALLVPPLL